MPLPLALPALKTLSFGSCEIFEMRKVKNICCFYGRIFATKTGYMKQRLLMFFTGIFFMLVFAAEAGAQCSICTKTASQLGVKPARGLNAGILYLMLTPLGIAGFIGVRWYKREKAFIQQEKLRG